MATNASIDEVAEILAGWNRPRVVAKLPLKPGGVDPLGLRQVNFDLMDRCIPGLNNTATRLRPYTLVAWAWWKAASLAKEEGSELVEVDRLKAFVDRVEVVFAVGHLMHQDFAGLLGSDTLNGEVVSRDSYDFSSKRWQEFRKKRALVTSLMAPVSYGPSAKEGLGLGFLSPRGDGAFTPTAEVMPAVFAFNDLLADILEDPCLASLGCGKVDLARMVEFHGYWAMDKLTDEERQVGTARLTRGARAETLSLIRSILDDEDGPLRVDEIRWRMALEDTALVPSDQQPGATALWRAMQAQQLHRLSLEALLVWLLDTTTTRPHQLRELAGQLIAEAGLEGVATFGGWLDAAARNEDGVADPVIAVEDLETVRQRDRPDLALDGLRIALAICGDVDGDARLYGGAPDRLPLERALARAKSISGLPLQDGLEILLSEWVIGQHIYWAVGRSGDETQRLRLMLDEGGWLAFASYANANPTPDRLSTLLRLAADSGLIDEGAVNDQLVYLVPGKLKARKVSIPLR